MVNFFETEVPIDLSKIKAIENLIGLTLPDEYKQHLLKYNGGQCLPNCFKFTENNNETYSSIDWFLAIYDGEHDNLENYITIYKIEERRLPQHIVPIAHDPGGNLICISCGENDYGHIYFWDHEKEISNTTYLETRKYNNLYHVASSLNKFFDNLIELE